MLGFMVMPAEELWITVTISVGSIDYLLGPTVVDVETIVDVVADITLVDGRTWRVRIMTAAALVATVERWRPGAHEHDVLALPDVFVVERPGLAAMSAALDALLTGPRSAPTSA
jgi:hypothetical protein